MKQLNHSKLKHWLYIVACILLAVFMVVVIMPLQAFAITTQFNMKLMVIIDDFTEKPILDDEQEDLVEFKNLSEISIDDNSHIAYAVSKSIAENIEVNSILKYAFNNLDARIYIYGELTISEFKHILDIDSYSVQTDIYDENGITNKKAYMSFGEEQEENQLEQIICLSNNPNYQSLIAHVPSADLNFLESVIVKHYCDTFIHPMSRATLVKNGFNYRNYVYSPEGNRLENCYLNMDYYLYKIEEESVEDYDYFAIRVNLCPVHERKTSSEKALSCTSFKIKMYLPSSNDHIFEYGPYSSSKAKDIDVSLGFGDSGISGEVGFTFSPGSGPTVDTTYYPSQQLVLWEVKKHWFFGADLNNAIYPFGISWASKGTVADLSVNTYVDFNNDYKSVWIQTIVRFIY